MHQFFFFFLMVGWGMRGVFNGGMRNKGGSLMVGWGISGSFNGAMGRRGYRRRGGSSEDLLSFVAFLLFFCNFAFLYMYDSLQCTNDTKPNFNAKSWYIVAFWYQHLFYVIWEWFQWVGINDTPSIKLRQRCCWPTWDEQTFSL